MKRAAAPPPAPSIPKQPRSAAVHQHGSCVTAPLNHGPSARGGVVGPSPPFHPPHGSVGGQARSCLEPVQVNSFLRGTAPAAQQDDEDEEDAIFAELDVDAITEAAAKVKAHQQEQQRSQQGAKGAAGIMVGNRGDGVSSHLSAIHPATVVSGSLNGPTLPNLQQYSQRNPDPPSYRRPMPPLTDPAMKSNASSEGTTSYQFGTLPRNSDGGGAASVGNMGSFRGTGFPGAAGTTARPGSSSDGWTGNYGGGGGSNGAPTRLMEPIDRCVALKGARQ